MKINELEKGQKDVNIEGTIKSMGEVRTIQDTGDQVVNVIVEDDTGEIDLSVYKEENISKLKEGAKIYIQSAKCQNTEYEGKKKVTLGRYGSFSIDTKPEAPKQEAPKEEKKPSSDDLWKEICKKIDEWELKNDRNFINNYQKMRRGE